MNAMMICKVSMGSHVMSLLGRCDGRERKRKAYAEVLVPDDGAEGFEDAQDLAAFVNRARFGFEFDVDGATAGGGCCGC